jgi:hypothetical protein
VLALTANPFYGLNGITPGVTLKAAARRLKLGKVFKIGLNDWYIATLRPGVGVLKVRDGVVQEIGVANANLTVTRLQQASFLAKFNVA